MTITKLLSIIHSEAAHSAAGRDAVRRRMMPATKVRLAHCVKKTQRWKGSRWVPNSHGRRRKKARSLSGRMDPWAMGANKAYIRLRQSCTSKRSDNHAKSSAWNHAPSAR